MSSGSLRPSTCGGFTTSKSGTAMGEGRPVNVRWFNFEKERPDPKKIKLALKEYGEEYVGNYDLTLHFGYSNHPNNPSIELHFNITIRSEFWVEPDPDPEPMEEPAANHQDVEPGSSDAKPTQEELEVAEIVAELEGEIALVPAPNRVYIFSAGDPFSIFLGLPTSTLGNEVQVEILSPGIDFIDFDRGSMTLSIMDGITTNEDAGVYSVSVVLSEESENLLEEYEIQITITEAEP